MSTDVLAELSVGHSGQCIFDSLIYRGQRPAVVEQVLNSTEVRANHNTPGSPGNTFRTVSFFFQHCIALSFFVSHKPRQYNHELTRDYSGHRFKQRFRNEFSISRGARVPVLRRAHRSPQPAPKIAGYRPTIGRLPREYRSTIALMPPHFRKLSPDHRIAADSFSQAIARPSYRCRLTFTNCRSTLAPLPSDFHKLSLDRRTAAVLLSQTTARPSRRCRLTFTNHRSTIAPFRPAFTNYRRQPQSTSMLPSVACWLKFAGECIRLLRQDV